MTFSLDETEMKIWIITHAKWGFVESMVDCIRHAWSRVYLQRAVEEGIPRRDSGNE
jgi:hypothetical protein